MNVDKEKYTPNQSNERPDTKMFLKQKKTTSEKGSDFLSFCFYSVLHSTFKVAMKFYLRNMNHIINDKKKHALRVQEMRLATSPSQVPLTSTRRSH